MYQQGYKSCKLEFIETEAAQYENTINHLIKAREEMAITAERYKMAANSVRANAERLSNELAAANARARDKPTVAPANTCRWSPKMEKIINGATDLITERDMIALKYNELREQCHLQ